MASDRAAAADPGSFRDPSGVVFTQNGKVYRQINPCYARQYEALMSSGLYDALCQKGLILAHEETGLAGLSEPSYRVIQPQMVPLISYPYEWCFGQLRDAALATLRIHRAAMEYGMILKDASAYNIQFFKGQPLLIDTLSFEFYKEGSPWIAYGQFCRHFLAPLFLMAHLDLRLGQLLRVYIDGIPLDLASTLLKGKGGFAAKMHIHWHAKAMLKHGSSGQKETDSSPSRAMKISRFQLISMIESLIRIVEKLKLKDLVTEWGDYYSRTNYSDSAFQSKKALVAEYLQREAPSVTWDLGANDGTFSRLALSSEDAFAAAFDIDPMAVERNYSAVKASKENLLPLLLDLANPSPSIGFGNEERSMLTLRQQPDCVLMLAVIHHLAISGNLPLGKIAKWLAGFCRSLIIEFVPKDDSQVKILLATREDIFPEYTVEGFEKAFGECFVIVDKQYVEGSKRLLYRMQSTLTHE